MGVCTCVSLLFGSLVLCLVCGWAINSDDFLLDCTHISSSTSSYELTGGLLHIHEAALLSPVNIDDAIAVEAH